MINIDNCTSLNDISLILYGKINYTNREKVKKYLFEHGIDWRVWKESVRRGEKRFCLTCGKELTGEQVKYCSRSCAAKTNNKKRKKENTNVCLKCGKPLIGKRKQRLYCSNSCQKEHEYLLFIEKWKNGEEDGNRGENLISNHIRRYLLEKTNNSCEICGCNWINPQSGKPIVEIHHIDGNAFNNKEENLQVLCPNHHAMTDNYKHNNKNGRVRRLKMPSSHSG